MGVRIKSINQGFLTKIITFVLMSMSNAVWGQQSYRIEVSAGAHTHVDLPVSLPVAELGNLPSQAVRLVEVTPHGRRQIPVQAVTTKDGKELKWMLDGETRAGTVRVFELERRDAKRYPAKKAVLTNTDIQLRDADNRLLLAYRHALQPVPEGVNPLYGRAGFIHPLNTPSGETLTRIQPPDHYHHYGLWNPWTRIAYDGKTYDLWNLGDNQGTVRFEAFEKVYEGPIMAGFDAVHSHVIFDGDQEKSIMLENWEISVTPQQDDRYLVDVESKLNPVGGLDVTLKEYRYGGLGLRAREEWTNMNSELLTSSGKTRADADGSLERWLLLTGELADGAGGILLMCSPENYNFPEPIRVWPVDGNGGRGDQFVNFSPTKNKDWVLASGHTYTLRYRLVVFDGELTESQAEQYWQSFANPPNIVVKPL